MDAVEELKSQLSAMVNGIDIFDPQNIDYIHPTYIGDHGKGKFRFFLS